ncbi:uncharacterized protein LOC124262425 [Haliotis rubra]|uniref:uncharacterized protein LOC124262425 n=1 Tax=Haliotis rubra TaxID=36100 RepID=UPI001EE5249F|nr:uncharacterized protein LOC124262425 [Haliotis rubra]
MAHTFNAGIELTFTDDNIAILRMRNGENRIDRTFTEAFNKALDTVERYDTSGPGSCLLTFPVVTVAAINGHAFAGGALLALNQDFQVMQTKRGWISLNEVFINAPLGQSMPLVRVSHDSCIQQMHLCTQSELRQLYSADVSMYPE